MRFQKELSAVTDNFTVHESISSLVELSNIKIITSGWDFMYFSKTVEDRNPKGKYLKIHE